jgi:hypothetical protein
VGLDTLVCAGIAIGVFEAIAFLIAAGVATYATYTTCVTQHACDRLTADLSRLLPDAQAVNANRQNLARGFDFALNGGKGYVWTGGEVPPPPPASPPPTAANPDLGKPTVLGNPGLTPGEQRALCKLDGFDLSQRGISTTAGPLEPVQGSLVLEARAPSQILRDNIIKSTPSLKTTSRPLVRDSAAHHLVPDELRTHDFVLRARGAGWDHDQAYNGLLVPFVKGDQARTLALSQQYGRPYQETNHTTYSATVRGFLDDLEALAATGGWSASQSRAALAELAWELRYAVIMSGGGISVDQTNLSQINVADIKRKLNLP